MLRKNRNLHKNENYASALLLALLYVLLAFYVSQNQDFKKKRCVQLCATDCNWLQLIAIETVCNWFKYKRPSDSKAKWISFFPEELSLHYTLLSLYTSLSPSIYTNIFMPIYLYANTRSLCNGFMETGALEQMVCPNALVAIKPLWRELSNTLSCLIVRRQIKCTTGEWGWIWGIF